MTKVIREVFEKNKFEDVCSVFGGIVILGENENNLLHL
jgi:hypothetical protein